MVVLYMGYEQGVYQNCAAAKVKFTLEHHVGPEWVQSHSSILSLTLVLDGGCFSFLFHLRLPLLCKGLQEVFIL